MPTAIKIRLPATFKQQLTTKQLKSNFLIIILSLSLYEKIYEKKKRKIKSNFYDLFFFDLQKFNFYDFSYLSKSHIFKYLQVGRGIFSKSWIAKFIFIFSKYSQCKKFRTNF